MGTKKFFKAQLLSSILTKIYIKRCILSIMKVFVGDSHSTLCTLEKLKTHTQSYFSSVE